MTRIVTPEEAQRLLDLIPGDREQAEYTVFDRMARYTPCHETYAAAPDLAHTVIQQAEQIKRLQEGIKELGEWDSKDYAPHLIYLGIITEKDMQP